ncbi:MAG: polysaccharide deacetylase family protein [Clostridiales bacterium]|nr:polysaccharide deacetylase family protein [Clostridiales bacterium]
MFSLIDINKRRALAAVIIAIVAACFIVGFGFVGRAKADTELVEYDGKVEHIFTHELVFDTAKAFSPNNSVRDCFDKDHLTAKEFKALLNELYKNNYVLVSLDKVISGESITVPRGKKPLVMSLDDMTYDTVDRGCIDKIIISDGKICDYTKSAQPQVSRERENVTILESFIEQHPDFSHVGGRATLCVNGYNGILGYRCTPDCKVSDQKQAEETEECKKLVAALKDLGYTFASHTYYHRYFNSSSASMIEKDCAAWKKYIEPIVGATRVLCYPAGEHKAKNAKNDIFKRYGFDTFLCVGNFAGTDFERASTDAKYIYRLPFDGTALRLYEKSYAHLADTRAIYDETRFRSFSYKGGYYK